jgi:hypothetical protein
MTVGSNRLFNPCPNVARARFGRFPAKVFLHLAGTACGSIGQGLRGSFQQGIEARFAVLRYLDRVFQNDASNPMTGHPSQRL